MEAKASNGVYIETGDIVLIRDDNTDRWVSSVFVSYDNNDDNEYKYYTVLNYKFKQCIPFIGNESLINTTEPYTRNLHS